MSSPRPLPLLYVITDRRQPHPQTLQSALHATLSAGTRFLQIREKDLPTRTLLSLGRELVSLARGHQALCMINDRPDVARALGADGVHLRANSQPISAVRKLLGPDAIIAQSTHSLEDIRIAEAEGADLVVFGPIYDTPSKRPYGPPQSLDRLREANRHCRIPVYAIGGITPARVHEVKDAGAYGVAVISAILASPSIPQITRDFLDALGEPQVKPVRTQP